MTSPKKKAKTGRKKAQVKKKASTKKKTKTVHKISKIQLDQIEEIHEKQMLEEVYANTTNVKYSPAYVSMAEAHFADGKSIKELSDLLKVSRYTIRLWAGRHLPFFQAIRTGQMFFLRSLPGRLLKWMDAGKSFESFAKQCGRTPRWMYDLVKKYPDFAEAKELGHAYSLSRWEDLGMAQVSGTLQRVKSVEPMLDSNKQPIIDKSTGQPLEKTIYTPSLGSDRTFKTMMQSRFKQYRDQDGSSDRSQQDELSEALAILNEEERQNAIREKK